MVTVICRWNLYLILHSRVRPIQAHTDVSCWSSFNLMYLVGT